MVGGGSALGEAVFVQARAAMVAEAGAKVVLFTAAFAMVGKLSRRHREEQPAGPFDELDVADHEHAARDRNRCNEDPLTGSAG